MPFPLRFAFVENEPLQLLIDGGWVFFCSSAAAVGCRRLAHRTPLARRDKIEAALIAGLFAVLVHSLFDFGLETLGVLLPFAAVFGTVLGRARAVVSNPHAGGGLGQAALAARLCGLIVGVAHRPLMPATTISTH